MRSTKKITARDAGWDARLDSLTINYDNSKNLSFVICRKYAFAVALRLAMPNLER